MTALRRVPRRTGPPRWSWAGLVLTVSLAALLPVVAAAAPAAHAAYTARAPQMSPAVPSAPRVVDVSAYPPASQAGDPRRIAFAPRVYPPLPTGIVPTPPLPACGVIQDCSFEAGGAGWAATDLTSPLLGIGVYEAGLTQGYGFFPLLPTEGARCAATGFDGNGPGDITLYQDITLTPAAGRLVLDYRAAWDLVTYAGTSTLPRTFAVEIQPAGGGAPLQSNTLLTIPPLTQNLDTGNITTAVPIRDFAGQSVRLVFRWHVPENYTGPAIFQLDRISVLDDACPVVANCSFEAGMLTPWLALEMATPFLSTSVWPAGYSPGYGIFTSAPTDGMYVVCTGFDGGGPADTRLVQDVVLPADAYSLDFDYRAGWDMLNFGASTLPRELFVEVEPAGGGAVLYSQRILQAPEHTQQLDTGNRQAFVDVSAFAGSAVRLVFRVHVPESFTGPGMLQLDRVRVTREPCASLQNCSFELAADSWNMVDLASPFLAMHVGTAGETNGYGAFTSAPTQGSYALLNGFDGSAGDMQVSQDLRLPLWADQLRFDFRAGWDMYQYGGSTLPREFVVELQPVGGGAPLVQDVALVAPPGTLVADTGPRSRTLPIGAWAGLDVRVVFRWRIPENFTGPAFFQLDHITLGSNPLGAGQGAPAKRLELLATAPNPSRDEATFRFTLPATADVRLEVVDVSGSVVWRHWRRGLTAGEHREVWNGRRSDGSVAPPGVYFARVHAPSGVRSRAFVRLQ